MQFSLRFCYLYMYKGATFVVTMMVNAFIFIIFKKYIKNKNKRLNQNKIYLILTMFVKFANIEKCACRL